MKTILRTGAALGLCAAFAACSSSTPAPAPAPEPVAAAPAGPPTTFDGNYSGLVTRVRTPSKKACRASHPATITISGGTLTYRASKVATFSSPLNQDGSFSAMQGDTTVKGTVGADGKLTGTSDGTTCGYTLSLTKKG